MPASIGVNLRVTGHCRQGGRKYMEDYFSVAYQQTEDEKDLEYAFFGIYDGHGGAEAAAYAKEHLMENIVSQRSFWSNSDDEVLRAVRDGFLATHLAMWKDHENWPKTATGLNSTAGTTASVAFIRRGKIYIGHVGDSGIVLGYQEPGCEDWKARPLTKDHKPENENEILRIRQCGGKVVAKSGVPRVVWNRPRLGHKGPVRRSTPIDEIPFLAVARSLGDLWSYNSQLDEFVVSPDPDCHVHVIDTNTFRCLVLGTDGLYNMVTPQMAVNVVQQVEKHNELSAMSDSPHKVWLNPSKCLVEKSLERWLSTKMRADNTSVVTLMLDPPGPPRVQVLRSRKRKYTDSGLEISMRYNDDQQESLVGLQQPEVRQEEVIVEGKREGGGSAKEEAAQQAAKRKEDGKLHSILYNQFTSKGEFLKTEDAKKVCSSSHDRKPIDASVLEEISRRRHIEMRKSMSKQRSSVSPQSCLSLPSSRASSSSSSYFSKYRPNTVQPPRKDETEQTTADIIITVEDAATEQQQSSEESTEEKDIQINEISSTDIEESFTEAAAATSSSSSTVISESVEEAGSVQEVQKQQTATTRKTSLRRLEKSGVVQPLTTVGVSSAITGVNKQRVNGDEVTTTLLLLLHPDLDEEKMLIRRRRGRPSVKVDDSNDGSYNKLLTPTTTTPPPPSAALHPIIPSINPSVYPSHTNTHTTQEPTPTPQLIASSSNTRVLRERRNTPDIRNEPSNEHPLANPNQTNVPSSVVDKPCPMNPSTAGNTGNNIVAVANNNGDLTARPCTSTGIRRRLLMFGGGQTVVGVVEGQQQQQGSDGKGKRVCAGGGEAASGWKEEQQDLSKGKITPSKTEMVEEDLMISNKGSPNLNPRSPLSHPSSKSQQNFSNRLRNRNAHTQSTTLIDHNIINTDKENNSAPNPQQQQATSHSVQQQKQHMSTRRSTATNNGGPVPTVVASSNTRLSTLRSSEIVTVRTRSTTSSAILTTKVTKLHHKKKSGGSGSRLKNSKLKQPKQGKLKMVAKLRDRIRDEGLRITVRGGGGNTAVSSGKRTNKGGRQ